MSDTRSPWRQLVLGDLEDISRLGEHPLLQATRLRVHGAVRALVQRFSVDVNGPDCRGRTALWLCVNARYSDMVTELLEMGADPNRADNYGVVPLMTVQNRATLLLLLRHGADPNRIAPDGRRVWEFYSSRPELMKVFCEEAGPQLTPDLDSLYLNSWYAWYTRQPDLFARDMAAIMRRNNTFLGPDRRTPLWYAASLGDATAISALVARGCDVDEGCPVPYGDRRADSPGRRYSTPLHEAVGQRKTSAVRALLRAGANPSRLDAEGETALRIAAKRGEPAVLDLLLKFDREVNAADCHGRTALWWAARRRHKNLARRLLQAGADPDIGSQGYRSARALLSRFLPDWGATATP